MKRDALLAFILTLLLLAGSGVIIYSVYLDAMALEPQPVCRGEFGHRRECP
jgi:hypothetical protein